MKKTIITATLLVVAIAAGYFYFTKKTVDKSSFEITGRWQVDSLITNPAVQETDSFLLLSLGEYKNFQFSKDSLFWRISNKDSISSKYYLKDSVLMIQFDSAYMPHPLKILSPNQIQLFFKDSTFVLLNKE